jgi:uncharacterized ferredoxin-like protein
VSGLLISALVGALVVACGLWWKELLSRKAREWRLRNPGAKEMIFVREQDEATVSVQCCGCRTCKNYFWVTHSPIQDEKFCPFCGVKFSAVRQVTGDEFKEFQVL